MCLICPLDQSPRDPSPKDPSHKDPSPKDTSPKDPLLACCPTLKLLNVLNVLNVLKFLSVLNFLNMPKDPSLAYWALFLYDTEFTSISKRTDRRVKIYESPHETKFAFPRT